MVWKTYWSPRPQSMSTPKGCVKHIQQVQHYQSRGTQETAKGGHLVSLVLCTHVHMCLDAH